VSKEVIIVEDDPHVLAIAQKRLVEAGYQPIPARDGLEALCQALDHPKCRRMITDYIMPGLGGDYWIRLLERFMSDWTVVVVSSEDIDPGPFVAIPKPVDYKNLVQVFERGA
jgi:two-component system, OmpR family, response regulator